MTPFTLPGSHFPVRVRVRFWCSVFVVLGGVAAATIGFAQGRRVSSGVRQVAPYDCRVVFSRIAYNVGLGGFGNRYPHQLSGGMRKRTSLAQTLALDPDIILMDEPFSALDIQTRQLMENEVLALWSAKKKAVLFITHDLDEAIAMSDSVVVMSAGPASRPIGAFDVDLARPRDVAEIKINPRFVELHAAIWAVLRDEVLKGYAQQLQAVST